MAIDIDSGPIEAWRAFIRANSVVVRALERDMQEEQGLPLTWYEVLARLSRTAEGRSRMQDLADSLVFSRSGVTRLLDRMQEAGLVERQPCSHDRRGWYAVITARGRETVDRARPDHLRGIRDHFLRHLDEADLQALRAALSKVVAAESPPAEEAMARG